MVSIGPNGTVHCNHELKIRANQQYDLCLNRSQRDRTLQPRCLLAKFVPEEIVVSIGPNGTVHCNRLRRINWIN